MAGLFGAGVFAGTVNTVVGSGSLLTFPTLLAFGYSPLVANVSNTVGSCRARSVARYGYRRELVGQRDRLRRSAHVARRRAGSVPACCWYCRVLRSSGSCPI